jgi:hypothetical protein
MDIHAALLIGIPVTPAAGFKRQVSGLLGRKSLIRPIAKEGHEETVSWAKKATIIYHGNRREPRGH